MKKRKLYTPDGEELSTVEEIKIYMMSKNYMLKEMKKSPYYFQQLENQDLSEYNEVVEKFKIRDQDGNPVEDSEIIDMILEENEGR